MQPKTTRRVGLALSGGSFRGMAHIGVLRVLARQHLTPDIIAGTSIGSLIGALYASGKDADAIQALAEEVFWPNLLLPGRLLAFCRKYLPREFYDLQIPLHVVVTAMPARHSVVLESGDLASAIEASCAMPWLRRTVLIGSELYMDGGMTCILPSQVCRARECRTVIGSDVWLRGSLGRRFRVTMRGGFANAIYTRQYIDSASGCDVLIQPAIPLLGMFPTRRGKRLIVKSGELAARAALSNFTG